MSAASSATLPEPALPVAPARTQRVPATFAQRRLWFMEELQPGNLAYLIAWEIGLHGELDAAALERAFQGLVARHKVFRTTFGMEDGDVFQGIAPSRALALPAEDVSRADAERMAREDRERPLSLADGPLLRVRLLRLGAAEHLLLVQLHHIIFDGSSRAVFFADLSELYAAQRERRPAVLPALRLQYPEFAVWQRRSLEGPRYPALLGYWQKQLQAIPPVLALPTDRTRPGVDEFAGDTVAFTLPEALAGALLGFARARGVSLFMLLLAGYQLLLARYSGQDDIVVGVPVAGRTRAEFEGLIGLFANQLVLRLRVPDGATFAEVLEQVRNTSLDAFEHQAMPFDRLVQELNPERTLSRNPLFQAVFSQRNFRQQDLALAGLERVDFKAVAGTASRFDLSMVVSERDGRIGGTVEFNRGLFDRATIERMLGHFRMLLAGAVAAPDRAVLDLPLLTPEETEQVLNGFNNTHVERALTPVSVQFEQVAARLPGQRAVVFGDTHLSFRELNEQANRYAHCLAAMGAAPGAVVAVCLNRSPELPAAILGILKTGAAYLPLDPGYPPGRVAAVLEDAGVALAVTESTLAGSFPAATALLLADADGARLRGARDTNPGTLPAPESLAYVLFTSGSTGRPKGCQIEHRNLAHYLGWAGDFYCEGRGVGSFPLLSSIGFDLTVTSLFLPLLRGRTLHILPQQAETAELLTAAFTTPGIDCVKLTPAHVTLLQYLDLPARTPVQLAIVGGEAFTPEQAAILHGLNPAMRIVNEYGPTETTVGCVVEEILPGTRRVLIGRPIENTVAYVLDGHRNPVAIGLPGELYLGGQGVGRGYSNRDELTREAFLPDPLRPGERMYRTGDLARWLPDGTLDYLGRADHQVKIRGFRIEPGEVESVLLAHTAVRECVVLAREGPGGEKRLVAYVVPREETPGLPAELRAWCARQLPDYMVPAALVLLALMPLSGNGKVDRRALPEPDYAPAGGEEVAPRTALERQLAGLWAEVLHLPAVGVEDNFFALGGHSLLAMQVVSRVRQALAVPVPLRMLFEAPTVAALAVALQPLLVEHAGMAAGPRRASRDRPLPLSFAQQRLWFLAQLEPGNPLYNAPSVMRLAGPLDAGRLNAALQAVAARHEVLRTHFDDVDGEPVQVIAATLRLPFTVDDFSGLAGTAEARLEHARRLALEVAAEPFNLRQGPLVRATLLRLAPEDHVLVLNMHHAVSDGWSIEVFWKELGALYAGTPALGELPLQYADFALWQRELLRGEEQQRQLAYWEQTLAGAPPVLELPTDRPRPRVESFRGDRHVVLLAPALLQAVQRLGGADGGGGTVFMTLLAAWSVLLARHAGQEEVVVGTPVSGRNFTQLEGLIGLFTNTLVLRTRVESAGTFRKLLAQVRENLLAAYEHGEVPLEKLVEVLKPERDLSRNPLFQVMLVYTDLAGGARHLGEAVAEPFALQRQSSKLDLTLYAGVQEGALRLSFEYNTDLFDRATIERLGRQLEHLLEAVTADPELAVGRIPLLDTDERRQMLEQWNSTARDYPRDLPLHRLFERQAALTPLSDAVADGASTLTYDALNRRANRIAHWLRGRAETLVGVCLWRTVDLPAVLLGILKSGAAYLPLDPAYPPDRLAHILADSGTGLVVTEREVSALLPAFAGELVCLEDLDLELDTQAGDDANLPDAGGADRLAYVLHTSGSTGKPKGVEITHRNLVNFLLSMQREPGLDAADTLLAVTTLSFDIAGLELYLPLVTGARVVLAAREEVLDATRLMALLERWRVTVLQATPSTWMLLREAGWPGSPGLKALCGGEALPPDLAAWLLPRCAELWNMYGPTETTIWSSVSRLHPGEPITIGRPIANTSFYVLDAHFEPVPPGVAGELYIGGEGVARGYWQRPELTAERFLPNPFRPGERLYRTGDVAHFTAAGDVVCTGRADHQVKVRGYRIELGEIEAALARHPDVAEAVAIVREDRPGDKRLIAYAAVRPGAAPAVAGLRQSLAATLPEYMVPAAIVLLPALPRTANGKIDRRALPDAAPEDEAPSAAPRTPLEEVLCGIFARVLGLERVGVDDSFFHLGGHSLLATRTVTRIRQALAVELPLRVLFEFPTVAGVARHVAALRTGSTAPRSLPPLTRAAPDAVLPLSFAQQRLWFLDQLEPDSAFYNLPWAVRLAGPLEPLALAAALGRLAARHDSLRTHFLLRTAEPEQVILPELALPLPVVDLAHLPPKDREAEATRLAQEEARRPFALARGPLFRALLLRLDAADHVLLLNLHHSIGDGWSLGILARELAALYEAERTGTPAALPALPLRYADFVLWQRRFLAAGALEEQLAYWKRHLAGAPPSIELATDRPRPSVQSFAGAKLVRHVPAATLARLQALGREEGATLFITLLAAFNVLLMRYSGQTDLVVGTAIAGRHYPETEGMVGFFANTLALRNDLSGAPDFRELLRRTRAVTLDAFAHQDVPFEKLVEELNPVRDLSRSPLVQVLFVQQNAFTRESTFGSLAAEAFAATGSEAKLDLTLNVAETATGELRCALEYSTALYDAGTIERLLGHYENLLTAFAADASLSIATAPLLGESERRQMLVEWNQTDTPYPREFCVHQLFEQQAARTPGHPALVFAGQTLTYAQLNARANCIAHHLQARGVRPGDRVALFLERCPDMLAAMLAVQKAGAAYVPIDPGYPQERARAVLEDAQVSALVTHRDLHDRLPAGAGLLVHLDREADELAGRPDTNPEQAATPDSILYVLFTSGSTGRPKGVQVHHRGIVNYLTWVAREFALTPADRFAALASYAFDMSVPELYATLLSGGAVLLAARETTANPEELAALLTANPVSIMIATPTTWSFLLEAGFAGDGIKRMIGGEALPRELFRRLLQSGRDNSLHNAYGPTEASVMASAHRCRHSEERIVIGRPLANTQLYVLDANLQPVPVGVPGVLYIAGDGVTPGYLGQPALTADRFLANPFTTRSLMYNSGDVVRYLADGTLEYLGRADLQVKLRGFRIELGEIEAALERHPAVRECAVIAREDTPGQKYLAAYVVPSAAQPPPFAALRAFLKQQLPDYMVPRGWVQMAQLPLAPTGKVDRKALPVPEPGSLDTGAAGAADSAARTPLEELVAGIFADVLRLDAVGLEENFFEAGGHSLSATQVVSRLRRALEVDLPLRTLFEAPTVAELAARLALLLQAATPASAAPPALRPAPRDRPLPLSFAQQRLWFLTEMDPENALYNAPMALRLQGRLDHDALGQALTGLVARHEILRTTYGTQQDEPVQVIAPAQPIALTVAPATEELAARMLAAEAARPFSLAHGPMLRAHLLQLGAEEHILLLHTHHIATDGWSNGILLRDLGALYAQALAGDASALPPLPIQYADYAVWQRGWLQGAVLEEQLSFWRQTLAGAPPLLALPADFPRPEKQTYRGGTHSFQISPEVSNAVSRLARQHGATAFMLLLGAFQTLLLHLTGQPDLVLGTDLANRTRVETEDLIGFFVNLLALRVDLAGDPTFPVLLDRVRRVTLDAYAHQDVPFDKLVEELQPARSRSHNPLVQALFVQQNTPRAAAAWPGLTLAGVRIALPSKFDMAVFVRESPDGIQGTWQYNADLFRPETIARMARGYALVLATVAEAPESTLSEIARAVTAQEDQQAAAAQKTLQEAGRQKLKGLKRRTT